MNSLKLTDERPYYKPFEFPWAYEYWFQSEQSHWLHTEVSMHDDIRDWKNSLTDSEKNFLTHIFRLFTASDIDVAGGYVNRYLKVFPQPEIRMMLCSFAAREATHIAAYSHLIETIGLPETTYNQFLEYESMRAKHDYFTSLADSDIACAIAAFSAFTEGLQLFSSFIMLLNFTRHGKMRGMGQIITWSIADETLHTEAMIHLFRIYIAGDLAIWTSQLRSDIYEIARNMVSLEDSFIDLAFEMGPMEDLTADDVKHYIRYIADRRLIALGLNGIFKVTSNPLLWVEEIINGVGHTNFFENKSIDYSKGALTGSWSNVWK